MKMLKFSIKNLISESNEIDDKLRNSDRKVKSESIIQSINAQTIICHAPRLIAWPYEINQFDVNRPLIEYWLKHLEQSSINQLHRSFNNQSINNNHLQSLFQTQFNDYFTRQFNIHYLNSTHITENIYMDF
jgi:hypothetical protein